MNIVMNLFNNIIEQPYEITQGSDILWRHPSSEYYSIYRHDNNGLIMRVTCERVKGIFSHSEWSMRIGYGDQHINLEKPISNIIKKIVKLAQERKLENSVKGLKNIDRMLEEIV